MSGTTQQGLHVLMDREHFRAMPIERRARSLLAYIEQTRAGDEPMKVAANLILREFKKSC